MTKATIKAAKQRELWARKSNDPVSDLIKRQATTKRAAPIGAIIAKPSKSCPPPKTRGWNTARNMAFWAREVPTHNRHSSFWQTLVWRPSCHRPPSKHVPCRRQTNTPTVQEHWQLYGVQASSSFHFHLKQRIVGRRTTNTSWPPCHCKMQRRKRRCGKKWSSNDFMGMAGKDLEPIWVAHKSFAQAENIWHGTSRRLVLSPTSSRQTFTSTRSREHARAILDTNPVLQCAAVHAGP